ncbi:MAG: hypothetical protein JST49_10540 [Bacteroidetes bacterium]|nr:hypothetical protein [Bacteroidota bacterium]
MKKFWRIFKKVMIILGVLSGATLFIVVLTSAIKHKQAEECTALQVKIDYDSGLSFLDEAEIAQRVNYLSGGNIVGKTLSTVDFRTLENEIEKNPYVDAAEVFADQSNKVVVDVVQKRPLLRVINNDGVSYYISEKNERIPTSTKFTSHVAIALGSVATHRDTKRDSAVQAALYNLVQYVRQDEFLDAMIDQIYVKENGEFELMPKTGGHVIMFGNGTKDIEQKFNRLKTFYREGLNKIGWTKYKTINLQYEGQVVCEKGDTTNVL